MGGFKLHDIFINVTEPALDLAMAVSIASSYLDRVVPADMVVVGEVGLSGLELVPVRGVAEALRLALPRGIRAGDSILAFDAIMKRPILTQGTR